MAEAAPKKVEVAKLSDNTLMSLPMNPPVPVVEEQVRVLEDGWQEYATSYGRTYYFNAETGEKSWKPPRKQRPAVFTLFGSADRITQRSNSRLSLPGDAPAKRGTSLPATMSIVFQKEERPVEEPSQVGKILRVGKLNTARLRGKCKKKWMSTYTVLTEYYLISTTTHPPSSLRFFKKAKNPEAERYFLPNAKIEKAEELSKRKNVYKLTTSEKDLLIQSKIPMEAEAWFHAIKLVIKDLEETGTRCDTMSVGLDQRQSFSKHDVSVVCREIKYPTPPGWTDIYDPQAKRVSYVNKATGEKWFSSTDGEGRTFFFENKSGRASWLLPSVLHSKPDHPKPIMTSLSLVPAPQQSKITDV